MNAVATASADLDQNAVDLHLPLVRMIALKLSRGLTRTVEVDDLISAGTLGLIDAASRYDRERPAGFKAYAAIRIRGAMVDWLRSSDWLPRSMRAAVRREESNAGVVSVNDLHEDGFESLLTNEDAAHPVWHATDRAQKKHALTAAITRLPTREREVLSLYYLEELTFRQIGTMYGFSEARACQIHAAAVAHLREDLAVTHA